ncbi:MAG: hypothetical protein JJT96_10055 [Opitutales bacterium]|nr:hypothetical protein [Opitutales bacterium]
MSHDPDLHRAYMADLNARFLEALTPAVCRKILESEPLSPDDLDTLGNAIAILEAEVGDLETRRCAEPIPDEILAAWWDLSRGALSKMRKTKRMPPFFTLAEADEWRALNAPPNPRRQEAARRAAATRYRA